MMNTVRKPRSRGFLSVLAFAAILSVAVGGPSRVSAQALEPLSPQPDPAALTPGLAVVYYFNFFRHVDELVSWEGYKEGKSGPVIEQLNYRSGPDKVLTSDNDDGVGAKITGLILFEQPGDYSFAFESNDGVRLEIGGQMVLEDPDVHADRFSDIGMVTVTEPGWYPLTIRYFERKNTSTLRFYWLPPGAEGTMPLVPPEVLAHLPE